MTKSANRKLIVAIDGPSGVGKGTVARAVAAALHYRHLDTGAMYRAVAWKALRDGLRLEDEAGVAKLARDAALDVTDAAVRIDGFDVTREIRTARIDEGASAVARLPAVRAVLVDRQRAAGAAGGIVMEGRDIGTVVFPDADVKIYLDALPEERARRRAQDPAHAGGDRQSMAVVASALAERDRFDKTRRVSPLSVAGDAVVIDTTTLTVPEVVERVLDVVRRRLHPSM